MSRKRRFLSKSRSIDSYIVRIYRRQEKNPRNLVGVVEEVEVEEEKSFKNVEELWKILTAPGAPSKSPPACQKPKQKGRSKQK